MDPVLLVVLVSAADAEAPGTPAALAALREAVGARGEVRLRTLGPGEKPESTPSAREGSAVVLHWEENGKRAHLRVHPRPSSPGAGSAWFERDLGFDERDAVEERGRAVGFALVAMLPDDLARVTSPSPRPTSPPKPTPAPKVVEAATPAVPEIPRANRAAFGELEVRGQFAVAPGGFGGGLGVSVGGQVFLGKTLGLHVDFGLRGAEAAAVESTASYLRAGGGLAVRGEVARNLELGGSVDVLVLREAMSHFSSDGDESVPVVEARALPGFRAEGRLAYFLTSSAAVSLGVGIETAVGKTDIFRDGKAAGAIVPVRVGVEPGVRIRF